MDALVTSYDCSTMQARGHGAGGARGGRFATGRGMGGGRGVFAGGRGGSRPQAWEATDRSKMPCVFFAQGKCAKGDACPFSHATPAEGSNHQEADPVNPPQRAALPDGRVRPGPGQPFAHTPTGRDDILPQSEQLGPDRINGVGIGRPSHSGHGEDLLRTSALRRSEPEPPRHQDSKFRGAPLTTDSPAVFGAGGKAYVGGPSRHLPVQAAVRTMKPSTETTAACSNMHRPATGHQQRDLFLGGHDQARTAAPLQQREKAPSQAGIIALSDGGFVTRKRAAELQLLKDDRSEAEPRRVRPRDGREQVRAQEPRPRPGMPESWAAPPGGKLSILDRLGPAKQSSASAPARERAVGPVQSRPGVPGPPFRAREDPARLRVESSGPPFGKHEEPPHQHGGSVGPLFRPREEPPRQHGESAGPSFRTREEPPRQHGGSAGQPFRTREEPPRQLGGSAGPPSRAREEPSRQHGESAGPPFRKREEPSRQHGGSAGPPFRAREEPSRQHGESTASPFRKREEPPRQHGEPTRQQSEPAERQRNSLQPLSRSQGLGVARPTRRTEGGKSDIVLTGKGLPDRLNTQHKTALVKLDFKMQHKSVPAKLDFKITSLGEIKSRKAKAEVSGAGGASLKEAQKTEEQPKSGTVLAMTKGSNFETTSPFGFSAAVPKDVQTPAAAPAPAPVVPFDPPQLDAEDMDEFSEWL